MRIIRAIRIFWFVLFAKEQYTVIGKDIHDGYHTFGELYKFRMLYNAAFANYYALLHPYAVEKSVRHYDGNRCFGGGWFIVNINLPTGLISNHYELKYWEMFQCKSVQSANFRYDGHSPKDVEERISLFVMDSHNLKHDARLVAGIDVSPSVPAASKVAKRKTMKRRP